MTIYYELKPGNWIVKDNLQSYSIGSMLHPALFLTAEYYEAYKDYELSDIEDKMLDMEMLAEFNEKFMRNMFKEWDNETFEEQKDAEVDKKLAQYLRTHYRRLLKEATIKEIIE